MQKVSPDGRKFIEGQEGRRYKAYRDIVGVFTIGCGHVIFAETFAVLDLTLTDEQVDALLTYDLHPVEAAINRQGLTLTQHQFDALADFCINEGIHAFENSTLLHDLHAGSYADAENEFARWHFAGGRSLEDLVRRRAGEVALFMAV